MAKTWIIYASCGKGHFFPALSLNSLLKDDSVIINILNYNRIFRLFYEGGYNFITKNIPFFWDSVFRLSQSPHPLLDYLRKLIEGIALRGFLKDLRKNRPSKLIFTHFLPLDLIEDKDFSWPVEIWCFITDFDVHRFWVSPLVNRYFVGSTYTRIRLMNFGVPSYKIEVSGIPVREEFLDTKEIFYENNRALRLLIFSNIFTSRELDRFIDYINLSSLEGYFICPWRKKHIQRLKKKLKNKNFRVFSYRQDIFNYIKKVDVVITKPGGSILSELLSLRKNFILYDVLGGQERKNLNIMLKKQITCEVRDVRELTYVIEKLAKNKDILKTQRERMKNFYTYGVKELLK